MRNQYFPSQDYWLSVYPNIIELFKQYELAVETISQLSQYAAVFKVRLPFVGPFSAGKSSILNAILDAKYFATSNDPQTAIPAEITYHPTTLFQARLANGQRIELDAQTILTNSVDNLPTDAYLEVGLPNDFLQSINHICLVDMPGWDSGNSAHGKAIDDYIARSLAYCIVISVEDGTLHESIALALEELKLHDTPVVLLVNKIDKVSDDDLDKSVKTIQVQVEEILGKPTLATIPVSARPKRNQGIENARAAIHAIERQADQIFNQTIIQPALIQLGLLKMHLLQLTNQDNLTSELLHSKRNELEYQKEQFLNKLAVEIESLDASAVNLVDYVLSEISNRLIGQIDYLADVVSNGGSVETQVTQVVRLTITEAIKTRFTPDMQRFVERISDEIPTTLSIDLSDLKQSTNYDANFFSFGFINSLHVIISTLSNVIPFGKIIGPLLSSAIALFFGSNRDSARSEENAQRESQKRQISGSLIPKVLSGVESNFIPILRNKINDIRQSVEQSFNEQINMLNKTLAQIEQDLLKDQADFENRQKVYQHDLAQVSDVMQTLEGFLK